MIVPPPGVGTRRPQRHRAPACGLLIVLAMGVASSSLRADEVELYDGSILRGGVLDFRDGHYTLRTTEPAPQEPPKTAGERTTRVLPLEDVFEIRFNTTLGDWPGDVEVISPPEPGGSQSTTAGTGDSVAGATTPQPVAGNAILKILSNALIGGAPRAAPALNPSAKSASRSTTQGTIKLQAGLHRVVFITWLGDREQRVRLYWSKDGRPRESIPPDRWFHTPAEEGDLPNGGYDDQGFRLADQPGGVEPQLKYSLYQFADAARNWTSGSDFALAAPTTRGFIDQVTQQAGDVRKNVGIVFTGYLKVDEPGEYQFRAEGNPGRLLFGHTPRNLWKSNVNPAENAWTIKLRSGSLVRGNITGWTESEIQCVLAVGQEQRTLQIPLADVLEISQGVNAVPRESPAGISAKNASQKTSATIWAKGKDDAVQELSATIVGLKEDALQLTFEGQDRRIKFDRLVAVRFPPIADGEGTTPRSPRVPHLLTLAEGSELPGEWQGLSDETIGFRTTWGQELALSITEVARMSVQNGKVLPLVRLEPAAVDLVPFFDRIWNWRKIDRSTLTEILVGKEIPCNEGLLVHSRTVLRYRLDGEYAMFRSRIGFQYPEGKLGNVDVRVLGDGRTLFEAGGVTADQPLGDVEVDITGVQELSLEVDFGAGQDVGDRFVWISPRLVRTQALSQK
ncbi:MAG: NPCBM/NEW2 domain-containing protein [Planctomycetaceae bacterium]